MVGADGADPEGQGHPRDELAVVSGDLEALDLHGVGLGAVAELPGGPERAFGEKVADLPLAPGDQAQELLGPGGVAELEVAGDRAVVDGVGVEAQDATARHRVDAVFVAEVVEGGDLGQVEDLQVGAEEADVLVVELGLAPLIVVDRDAAAHGAVRTAVGRDSGVIQALAVHFPGIGVVGLAEVPHGQGGHLVAPGQDAVGALDGPAGLLVELVDLAQVVVPDLLHPCRVGLGDGLGALDHDGLEELRAHDRADARPSSGPALQAADDGVADHVFAALSDVEDADALAVFRVDPVVGGVGALAPDGVGRQELDLVVLDGEHRRALGLALYDQGVVTGLPELFGDPRSQVAVAVAARHRGLAGDDRFPGVRGGDAGDWAEGDDELVVGAEGVDPGLELVKEDLGGEAASAHPLAGEFLGKRFFLKGLRGQVDSQDLAGPPVHVASSRRYKIPPQS